MLNNKQSEVKLLNCISKINRKGSDIKTNRQLIGEKVLISENIDDIFDWEWVR